MEEKEIIPIHDMIHEIRGCQVMLDEDLAKIYQVETKRLNQAVRRNIERFPLEFMFQLTTEEYSNLKSQFVTSSLGGGLAEENTNLMSQIATTEREPSPLRGSAVGSSWGGRRKLPFAFTEHGVIMLSSILNSKIATQINIAVVKAFISMRRYISSPMQEKLKALEKVLFLHIDDTNLNLAKHTSTIDKILIALDNLIEKPKPAKRIGFYPD